MMAAAARKRGTGCCRIGSGARRHVVAVCAIEHDSRETGGRAVPLGRLVPLANGIPAPRAQLERATGSPVVSPRRRLRSDQGLDHWSRSRVVALS